MVPLAVTLEPRELRPARLRLSLRATLVLVALVGLGLGAGSNWWRARWEKRCLAQARFFKLMALEASGTPSYLVTTGLPSEEVERRGQETARAKRLGQHYAGLYRKYTNAAHDPWSPVAPDPPDPGD